MNRVVFIGGAGDTARVAEEKLLSMLNDCRLLLANIDLDRAEKARDLLSSPFLRMMTNAPSLIDASQAFASRNREVLHRLHVRLPSPPN